jgi:hypothetical protein
MLLHVKSLFLTLYTLVSISCMSLSVFVLLVTLLKQAGENVN